MSRKVLLMPILAGSATVLALGLAACFSDPRSGEEVTVTDTCQADKLSTVATSPEASLRAYLDSADLLVKRTNQAEAELIEACNALDTELGLPTGQDSLSACRSIASRLEAVIKGGTAPFGPGAPEWAELRTSANCTAEANALEKCISTCAGPCDSSKCADGKLAGKCEGKCKGECVTTGTEVPCNGRCVGEIPLKQAPQTCVGECTGICPNGIWAGSCEASCSTFFIGNCGGTCTGQCNGAPINVAPVVDAGAPDSGGSDGGDAGAPPPPTGGPPPSNADGNCKGTCVGVCSSKSNGFCNGAPCLKFNQAGPPDIGAYNGYCPGTCGGSCKSATGSGATATCTGDCTERKETCSGVCRGACEGTVSNGSCEGTLKCGQNAECENACQARVELLKACSDSKAIEAYAVSDEKLHAALVKHGPKLGKALASLTLIRSAISFVTKRSYGDFVAIGAKGDLAKACVAKGNRDVVAAEAKLAILASANPTVRKAK